MTYRVCQHCGKGTMAGARSRHRRGVASHKFENRAPKTKRVLRPNLHWQKVVVNNMAQRMLLCTRCVRLLKRKTKIN